MNARWALVCCLCLGVLSSQVACNGRVTMRNTPDDDKNKNNTTPPDTKQNNTPVQYKPFVPAKQKLRRLTVFEYQQTIKTLFGPGITVPNDLEPDTPINGLTAIGSSSLSLSSSGVTKYEAASTSVAEQIMRDGDKRFRIVPCQPVGDGEACARQFIETFGYKLWRRPVTSKEIDRYAQLTMSAQQELEGDFWRAMEFCLIAMMQSPNFVYRVELGQPDARKPERFKLTQYEIATRLSYLIWGTSPDAELLQLAKEGGLESPTQVKAQAQKMLADPRARVAMRHFWEEHLELHKIKNLSKDKTLYPMMNEQLAQSMVEETLHTLDDLVFGQNADLRTMFTTRKTFLNEQLINFYGVQPQQAPSGEQPFVPFEHPASSPRQGILTHASLLAINAHPVVTSPTHRGLFIRQSLMCKTVPAPPDDVSTELPEANPDNGPVTLRQRIENHIFAKDRCKGCHVFMDQIGFAFEHFDAVGQYRTKDNGLEIDSTGSLEGVEFVDALGLNKALHDNKSTMDCLVRKAYRYAVGHVESINEEVVIAGVQDDFEAAGYRFDQLIMSIVSSDGFLYVSPPSEEEEQ